MTVETSRKKIKLAERRKTAMDLRKAGYTFRQIAALISETYDIRYSASMAYRDVTHELDRVMAKSSETAEQVLALELTRLDEMLVAWYPGAVGKPSIPALELVQSPEMMAQWLDSLPEGPDKEAAKIVLKIMERRAKYLQLDKDDVTLRTPQPLAVITAGLGNVEEDELDHIIANLQAALGDSAA